DATRGNKRGADLVIGVTSTRLEDDLDTPFRRKTRIAGSTLARNDRLSRTGADRSGRYFAARELWRRDRSRGRVAGGGAVHRRRTGRGCPRGSSAAGRVEHYEHSGSKSPEDPEFR